MCNQAAGSVRMRKNSRIKRAYLIVHYQQLTLYDSSGVMNHKRRAVPTELCSPGIFDRPRTRVWDPCDDVRRYLLSRIGPQRAASKDRQIVFSGRRSHVKNYLGFQPLSRSS